MCFSVRIGSQFTNWSNHEVWSVNVVVNKVGNVDRDNFWTIRIKIVNREQLFSLSWKPVTNLSYFGNAVSLSRDDVCLQAANYCAPPFNDAEPKPPLQRALLFIPLETRWASLNSRVTSATNGPCTCTHFQTETYLMTLKTSKILPTQPGSDSTLTDQSPFLQSIFLAFFFMSGKIIPERQRNVLDSIVRLAR